MFKENLFSVLKLQLQTLEVRLELSTSLLFKGFFNLAILALVFSKFKDIVSNILNYGLQFGVQVTPT
jgi:hypothetical protein